jgi:hypothetical protein
MKKHQVEFIRKRIMRVLGFWITIEETIRIIKIIKEIK